MVDSLLSQVKPEPYFSENFWKKILLILGEGVFLFLSSFIFIGYLNGEYNLNIWSVLFFSLFIVLFYFLFVLRSFLEDRTSFLVFASLVDVFMIFLPFVIDLQVKNIYIKSSLLFSYWLYFLLLAIFLFAFFSLATLKIKSVDFLYAKFSWSKVTKGSSFYLLSSLSLFFTFCLLAFVFSGLGTIFSSILNGIIHTFESSLNLILPKFSTKMNFEEISGLVGKKYFGDAISLFLSKTFHISVSPTTQIKRAFDLILNREFNLVRGNKIFILVFGFVTFSFFYSLFKIVELIVAIVGKLGVELLVASRFIKKTWLKVSKETITF